MNRVKKISIVFVIMMLIICMFTSKTYAALNCNVNLSASKNKVTYKEQFSVYVAISNLQTTKGIIAIGAVVNYDTDSLTLVSIEGQNKWSDPFHNSSNGKITSFKNELSTKNENVFKITFNPPAAPTVIIMFFSVKVVPNLLFKEEATTPLTSSYPELLI